MDYEDPELTQMMQRYQKVAWDVLKNFDHAIVLREDELLLPVILDVYEKQGIKKGHPQNKIKGEAFKTPPFTSYPDYRLVVACK